MAKASIIDVFLDLGCGYRKKEAYIGLDKSPLDKVDIVCDFEQGLPIKDNCVDKIYSNHLFEHINNWVQLFEEVYRVCRSDAIVEIRVPYYASIGAFKDPTHVHFFTEETIRYFTKDKWYGSDYGFKTNFEIVKIDYDYMFPFNQWIPFISFFRKYLLNVVHSMTISLKVIK